jgi:hypothetical protein
MAAGHPVLSYHRMLLIRLKVVAAVSNEAHPSMVSCFGVV